MTLSIEFDDPSYREGLEFEKIIRDAVEESLDYENCPYDVSINVLITGNDEMQEINNSQRGIDKATDVLSFPMTEYVSPGNFDLDEESPDIFDPDTGELLLGDIVINRDRVFSQALEYGHSPDRELAFLTAHSMLHLMGYDHMEDQERLEMERRQEEILKRRGYLR